MARIRRFFDYQHIRTFDDIPQLVGGTLTNGMFPIDVAWPHVDQWVEGDDMVTVDMNPDFQREHVWKKEQSIAYVEYCLRGGRNNTTFVFNNTDLLRSGGGVYEIVDGKQRLTAIHQFMHDKLEVFDGLTCSDMKNASKHRRFPIMRYRFTVSCVALQSRSDVLRYYIDHNTGGTPHTGEEIERVNKLLRMELDLEQAMSREGRSGNKRRRG